MVANLHFKSIHLHPDGTDRNPTLLKELSHVCLPELHRVVPHVDLMLSTDWTPAIIRPRLFRAQEKDSKGKDGKTIGAQEYASKRKNQDVSRSVVKSCYNQCSKFQQDCEQDSGRRSKKITSPSSPCCRLHPLFPCSYSYNWNSSLLRNFSLLTSVSSFLSPTTQDGG